MIVLVGRLVLGAVEMDAGCIARELVMIVVRGAVSVVEAVTGIVLGVREAVKGAVKRAVKEVVKGIAKILVRKAVKIAVRQPVVEPVQGLATQPVMTTMALL